MAVLVSGRLRSHPAGHHLFLEVHGTAALRALVLPTSYSIQGFFQQVPPSTPSTVPIRFSNTLRFCCLILTHFQWQSSNKELRVQWFDAAKSALCGVKGEGSEQRLL